MSHICTWVVELGSSAATMSWWPLLDSLYMRVYVRVVMYRVCVHECTWVHSHECLWETHESVHKSPMNSYVSCTLMSHVSCTDSLYMRVHEYTLMSVSHIHSWKCTWKFHECTREYNLCQYVSTDLCMEAFISMYVNKRTYRRAYFSMYSCTLIWTSLYKSWQTSIYVSVDTHRNMYVNMYILTYIFQTTVSTDTYMDVLSTFVQRCSNGCKWVHSHECTWLVRKIGREDQSISGVMGCNISAVRACMYICQEQCIYASICRRRYVQYMTNGVRIFWCMFGCIYVNMSLQMYTWVYVCPYMSIIYGSIYLCQHISTALYMDALISMYVNKCTYWRTYFNMCQ